MSNYIDLPVEGGSGGITTLTGDVSATGSGSVAATVNSVGGESSTNIATVVGNIIAGEYFVLAGQSGGQIANGDTAAGNWAVYGTAGNLSLRSNATSTPGYVQITDGSGFLMGSPNALAVAIPAYYIDAGASVPAPLYMSLDATNNADENFNGISIDTYGGGSELALSGCGGSVASPTYLNKNEALGQIYFATWDGSVVTGISTSSISAFATENQSVTKLGTELSFQTTITGTTTRANSLTLSGLSATLAASGTFLVATDNTGSLGLPGASRIANIYFGTSIQGTLFQGPDVNQTTAPTAVIFRGSNNSDTTSNSQGGAVSLLGGSSVSTGHAGNASIVGGVNTSSGAGAGGSSSLQGGASSGSGNGGASNVTGGFANGTGNGGIANILGGGATGGNGGALNISGGTANGSGTGGNIAIKSGIGGTNGTVQISIGNSLALNIDVSGNTQIEGVATLGATSTTPIHIINGLTSAGGATTAVFTNVPTGATTPSGYLEITINGVLSYIPYFQ